MTRNLDGTKRPRPEAKPLTKSQKEAAVKRVTAKKKVPSDLAKIERLRKAGVII